MKRKSILALALTVAMGSVTISSLPVNVMTDKAYAAEIESTVSTASVKLTDEDIANLNTVSSLRRTSVHDPSVFYDEASNEYYIFGSHMGVSKTSDLKNWDGVYSETVDSGLYDKSYENEYKENAFTGKVKVRTKDGTVVEADFGTYDINDWIGGNTIQGNQWAPDIIYNKAMGKYCLYMSLNGAKWNSSIVLLTSDKVEGPYVYQGPVIFTGFSKKDTAKSYTKTDLQLVTGDLDELPSKYNQLATTGKWGDVWPHAIDPCVYYDEEGNLKMTYGSWSGGIYTIELDENTGLRDYTVKYESNYDAANPKAVTSDEYFGKKIAGGAYVSGEGSYIKHIGDYYYLFISYGFYSPEGGYNMRVFRSKDVYGPYVDENGKSAIFDSYVMNYDATNSNNNRGEKLMGGYKWDTMVKGEISQGHNSVITTADGRTFLIYHTKFNDGTATHEIRVHELYVNEDGWLVTAPYEYRNGGELTTGSTIASFAGEYQLIVHKFQTNYSKLECVEPVSISLNVDGTVTGAKSGTWELVSGSPYINVTIDGNTYKGVISEECVDGTDKKVKCFSAVDTDGETIWGSGLDDREAIASEVKSSDLFNTIVRNDITLPTSGKGNTTVSWTSSDPSALSNDGKVGNVTDAKIVTLTKRISKGDYYYDKEYQVTVEPKSVKTEDGYTLVGEYLKDTPTELSDKTEGSLSITNPFNVKNLSDMNLNGGASIEFDVEKTGDINVLGTLLAITGGGKLYFTPGSYLGYNADGGYVDANLLDYKLNKDYIGDKAHVRINLLSDGFEVLVNGTKVYDQTNYENKDTGFAGTLTDYSKVLSWLHDTADTLSFGAGSWWGDAANAKISNVKLYAKEAGEQLETVEYKNDKVELKTNDSFTALESPFYGKDMRSLHVEYTIKMDPAAAANGWDGIFSLFNSKTGGRISFQTAPYICFNPAGGDYLDINSAANASTDKAPSMKDGKEHKVVIDITKQDAKISVDGEALPIITAGAAGYGTVIDYISKCNELTLGVGLAKSAYWNTEICTLTDLVISGEAKTGTTPVVPDEPVTPEKPEEPEKPDETKYDIEYVKDYVDLPSNDTFIEEENPYFGKSLSKMRIEYSIKMRTDAAANGWDGIFSLYETASGNKGRISFQSAPYICLNECLPAGTENVWADINQPGHDAEGGTDMAPAMKDGEYHKVAITVASGEGISVAVDGKLISLSNAGNATADEILSFAAKCDKLSYGVGLANTSFWNTELCELKDVCNTNRA